MLTVVSAALAPAIAYVGKLIVDAVVAARAAAPDGGGSGACARRCSCVVLELGLIVAAALVERTLGLIRQLVGARLGIDVNVMILEKALTLKLRHFEDSEFYDKLTRARREASSRPLSLVQENFQVLRNGLTLAGYIALLVRVFALAGAGAAAGDGAGLRLRGAFSARASACATGARPRRAS